MRADHVHSSLQCCLAFCLLLVMPSSRAARAQASVPRTEAQAARTTDAAFAVIRIKASPDSEADDWGIGMRGRNFWAVHVTTEELIEWAYGLNARQIEHAPAWVGAERFDVDGLPEADYQPTREQYRSMVKAALAQRFHLKCRASEKVLPVYVLSVAEGGLKIPKSPDGNANSSWGAHQGWLSIQNMTFADAAQVVQRTIFNRPVLDETGLSEKYSFILKWRGDETQFGRMQGVTVPEEAGTQDTDDIYTASRKQLGVKIQARNASAPTLVVDSIERPSPN